MSEKLMFIEVRGKQKSWCFTFYGNPEYLADWKADGLFIEIVENTVPMWVAECGLTRPWCFLQDLLNFKNPFRK